MNRPLTSRQAAISEYLARERYVSTERLAAHFHVSLATMHRDLDVLSLSGKLRKVHGGATSLLNVQMTLDPRQPNDRPFAQRLEANRAAKQKIAEEAEKLIAPADILFLDSSTTCLCLARRLQNSTLSSLSIVTNSVLICEEFHRFPPNFMLLCLGGSYNSQLNSFLGSMTIENLRRLRITKAFFSGVGLNSDGLTTYHEDHAAFLQQVIDLAPFHCLLLDSSKFERAGLFPICPLNRIQRVISEQTIPAWLPERMRV
ncbi:MAG: DeoR/GlpR transcriptional regulator [Victivallales bacterium]|nr:DeoR/GlpR transcriptional regulator [Victivallales bacterium]